jgi:hypothetical protein
MLAVYSISTALAFATPLAISSTKQDIWYTHNGYVAE